MSDMTRAAVVLAVSAMDSYFTGVFAERLVPFLKNRTSAPKALSETLEAAGLDAATAIALLGMERPYRRVRKLMDAYLERHTTQRVEAIDKLFLAYGFKDFCKNVQRRTKKKQLLASVRKLVERRHEIAHKGDLNSHGRLQEINVKRIKTRILNTVCFVSCADELLQKQLA
jgi:hypothetical protein